MAAAENIAGTVAGALGAAAQIGVPNEGINSVNTAANNRAIIITNATGFGGNSQVQIPVGFTVSVATGTVTVVPCNGDHPITGTDAARVTAQSVFATATGGGDGTSYTMTNIPCNPVAAAPPAGTD
jgi:hypothetical protein